MSFVSIERMAFHARMRSISPVACVRARVADQAPGRQETGLRAGLHALGGSGAEVVRLTQTRNPSETQASSERPPRSVSSRHSQLIGSAHWTFVAALVCESSVSGAEPLIHYCANVSPIPAGAIGGAFRHSSQVGSSSGGRSNFVRIEDMTPSSMRLALCRM